MFRHVFPLMLFLLAACANQVSPTGGPKDEAPPMLVSSIPQNNAVNYKGKIIQFEFNKEVQLNKPYQEVLIVPSVSKDIKFRAKRKKFFIEFKEDWRDSTTYSVSVRQGVKDLHEGNTPENVKIAFSSGPIIDSLLVVGRVYFALQHSFQEKKKITVALHSSDTFNIFEDVPDYFTETDDRGRFSLENIRQGKYEIYAFHDENKDLIVQSKTEDYGFLANPILLNSEIDSLKIPIVHLNSKKPVINKISNNGIYTKIAFNKLMDEYTLNYNLNSNVVHSFGDSQNEVIIYNPKNIVDSIQFTLQAQDKLSMPVDSVFYVKETIKKKNFVADNFLVDIEKTKVETLSNAFISILTFSKPLTLLNYDSIVVAVDSTQTIHFDSSNISYDSLHKKITITKDFTRYIKEDSLFLKYNPELLLGEGAFISIENDTSKALHKKISFIDSTKTGTLLIEVQSKEPHYEIQLLSEKGSVVKSVHDIKEYSFKGLKVGKYTIRVIMDKNNNSKWDPGNIYKKIEPEPVYFYKNLDGKYSFPIRANWELGPFMLVF